jgi:hypothetical protein
MPEPTTVDTPDLDDRLSRLEAKLDAVGAQQTWIVNHAQLLFQGLLASPMGAMIKKHLPEGASNG